MVVRKGKLRPPPLPRVAVRREVGPPVELVEVWDEGEGCEEEKVESINDENEWMSISEIDRAERDGLRVAVLTLRQGQQVSRMAKALRENRLIACQRRGERWIVLCVRERERWVPVAKLIE